MTSQKDRSDEQTKMKPNNDTSISTDESTTVRRPSLNPDAPSFTPQEQASSLLAASAVIPSRRRSMIPDPSRTRNHSDTTNTQGIPSLLSLMPDYNPSQLVGQDYRRRAHTATGTTTYPPLLTSITSRKLSLNPVVDANRQRSHSGPESAQTIPPAVLNPLDLSGIHSLTRIMVEILRQIHPVVHEEHEEDENQSVSTSNAFTSIQSKYT